MMIGSSKNNRENYPRKCFRTQEKENRVKFNSGLSARGVSAYERGGDASRKFWIKPLKETDLGVAQAFFDP